MLCNMTYYSILVKMTFWPQMTPDWHLTHNIGRGSQADAYVWVLWSCYVTWTSYSNFSENDLLTPSDPKWPQIDIWPHNIGKVSQADANIWVLWSCYVTRTIYSIFSENDLLTPVTPNDPGLIFRTITFVEGVKLIHVRKWCVNATYSEGLDAFLVKMTFWPLWPQMTPDDFLGP